MAVNAATEQLVQSAGRARVSDQLLAFAEALLLSVWLGSMIFFSFAVAPSAFAVLPSRELAGAVVTSTIAKVEILGLIIGVLLILIHVARWRGQHSSPVIKWLKLILIAVMTAAAALSRYWISPAMVGLRAAMGGQIDDVPPTDPLRVQFNDLHQYSVTLMGIAILSGIVVLFLTVRSWLRR